MTKVRGLLQILLPPLTKVLPKMTGAEKEARAIASPDHKERSEMREALAAEVQVIKADNPKITRKQIADKMGFEGDDKVERIDAILKSDETKRLKEALEYRAITATEGLMDLLIARAQTLDDPEQLKAIKMVIEMWDKKQSEKTINIMVDNRSVSIPFIKNEWGTRGGQPYHIPTWERAMTSDDMALVCRTGGCAMNAQKKLLDNSVFTEQETQ